MTKQRAGLWVVAFGVGVLGVTFLPVQAVAVAAFTVALVALADADATLKGLRLVVAEWEKFVGAFEKKKPKVSTPTTGAQRMDWNWSTCSHCGKTRAYNKRAILVVSCDCP